MAQSDNKKKFKGTKELYKKIYRLRISGMNRQAIADKLGKSLSTIDRGLDWCRKNGFNELPKNDELLENTLNDINLRRSKLIEIQDALFKRIIERSQDEDRSKELIVNEDNLLKINNEIIKLDQQALTIKGLIVTRESHSKEDYDKCEEELWGFMKKELEMKENTKEFRIGHNQVNEMIDN